MAQNANAFPLGIHCTDPGLLRSRILVSGQMILDAKTAEIHGYGHREVIVPTDPQAPTDEQLAAIIASEETRHKVHLVSLPASIGNQALKVCQAPDFKMIVDNYKDLGEDFIGAPLGSRLDKANQVNVSVDGDGLKVGDHVDTWPDPNVQLAILNMGPGERWHRLAPAFSRDDMNGQRPTSDVREAHLQSMIASGIDCDTYWIRLEPPRPVAPGEIPLVEAILPSPVARYLHEGSTLGAQAESTAIFIATPSDRPTAVYPSLV